MKQLMFLLLLAVAAAAPQSTNPMDVEILRYETDNIGLGNYKFSFEQSDGTQREEQGELINADSENESILVKGSYSWIGPDNNFHKVNYVADKNGYQPYTELGTGGGDVPSAGKAVLG